MQFFIFLGILVCVCALYLFYIFFGLWTELSNFSKLLVLYQYISCVLCEISCWPHINSLLTDTIFKSMAPPLSQYRCASVSRHNLPIAPESLSVRRLVLPLQFDVMTIPITSSRPFRMHGMVLMRWWRQLHPPITKASVVSRMTCA
jgi:hypothetical protein